MPFLDKPMIWYGFTTEQDRPTLEHIYTHYTKTLENGTVNKTIKKEYSHLYKNREESGCQKNQ